MFLKTHYYGGIKKYQWLARPLAIHGVVLKADGSQVEFRVGEEPGDPVFTVLDLLPHLARKAQMDKKVSEAFEGEKLNVLVGSLPIGDKDTKERFKLFFLKFLQDTYGLTEEDLVSAELEVVPAGPARDLGWDRSLVAAYGHDDRSCAYPALEAILDTKDPEHACIVLFYDKEEVGSDGNTSAQSYMLEDIVERWLEREGISPHVPAPGADEFPGPLRRRHRRHRPGLARSPRKAQRRQDGLRHFPHQVHRPRRQIFRQRRPRRIPGLAQENLQRRRGHLAGGPPGQGG